MLGYLGKDDELRKALDQQQEMLSQLAAQNAANAPAMNISRHDTMRIALGVMLLVFLFK
jgi:hypothetical protein